MTKSSKSRITTPNTRTVTTPSRRGSQPFGCRGFPYSPGWRGPTGVESKLRRRSHGGVDWWTTRSLITVGTVC